MAEAYTRKALKKQLDEILEIVENHSHDESCVESTTGQYDGACHYRIANEIRQKFFWDPKKQAFKKGK